MYSVVTPSGYGLGLLPRHPNINDLLFVPNKDAGTPPNSVDLTKYALPVRDQGAQGSCTSFTLTAAEYSLYLQAGFKNPFAPAAAFQYAMSRLLENGNINDDTGATITGAVEAAQKYGMTAETNFPYNDQVWKVMPDSAVLTNASHHLTYKPYKVAQTADALLAAIASKHMVVLGVAVYAQSFEDSISATTGFIPTPKNGETLSGWHAQPVYGYDLFEKNRDGTSGVVTTQNSWGPSFGDKGYLHFPLSYLLDPNICSDVWALCTEVKPA